MKLIERSAELTADEPAEPASSEARNGFVIYVAIVAAIGGLLFGYDSAVINGAVGAIGTHFHAAPTALGIAVSSALIGAAVGAFFIGRIADVYGRLLPMRLAAILFVVSALGATFANSLVVLSLFRILGGVGVGIASVIAPMYIAEVAPAHLRGRLASLQQLAIVSGIFLSLLVDYLVASAAGTATAPWLFGLDAWRWMFVIMIVPAVAYFVLSRTIPESPRYLIAKSRTDEATVVLRKLLGSNGLSAKIAHIRESLSGDRTPTWRDLRGPALGLLPIVWVGIGLSVFQQFVGINVIFYYSTVLWHAVGFSENDSFLITVITSVVNIVTTLVAIALIDRIGRRPLLLIGSAGMVITLGILALIFGNAPLGADHQPSLTHTNGLVALWAANLFVFAFGMSWGPAVWVLLGEIFSNHIRAAALSLAACAQWIANWAITVSFPPLQHTSLGLAYGLYTAFALLSFLFVLRFVRETNGSELEEVRHLTRAALRDRRRRVASPCPQDFTARLFRHGEADAERTPTMRTTKTAIPVRHIAEAVRGKSENGNGKSKAYAFDAALSTAVVLDGKRRKVQTPPQAPLSVTMLDKMQRYWRAANYLCIGQIYLSANPLLREPLTAAQIKPRLLGHWGTSPGQNFIYIHLNRLIKEHDANVIYISGPGHGGPSLNACSYLEGTYTDVHPEITRDENGLRMLFRTFSTPGGVPSHCGPHVPNSMHEGGELGYSLIHAFGAAFDNPDLIVACVIGDGESETCPLEGSWKSVNFLNPVEDGAVLPILHLNGYKISGPTVQARTSDEDLTALYVGRGYKPYFVEGDDPEIMHQLLAGTLDAAYADIRAIQTDARENGFKKQPVWPMIVLRSPKGWTCPKEIDGIPIEGTFRAHQVPLDGVRDNPRHLAILETWMKSYDVDELFDANGTFVEELAELAPRGNRRMGASPHVNGGRLLTALELPDFCEYALDIPGPGLVVAEAPRKLGEWFADVIRRNPTNFRMFSPDETNSNRLNAVFKATTRRFMAETVSIDDELSPQGRVMEVLSEHCCEGWLEGYLLTGRHGMWSSYEAFAQVVDSMITQHAKWLEQCHEYAWRRPLASLNVLITGHAWRNDHNGFSHQATGFVDNALARRSEVIRAYYPPDGNCLLSVFDHCMRSRNYVNIVTCGKQPQLQWLTMSEAVEHCSRGASTWAFATNDGGREPDVVLACAGDVPTIEICATSWLLQKHVPGIKVRVVNVVDLMALMMPDSHPHGLDTMSFDTLFTKSAPVIFAFHNNRWLVHSLVHGRSNEARFHVRGYMDRGTTTTPFDMVVLNEMSRFQLAIDALKQIPRLRAQAESVIDLFAAKLAEHHAYIRQHLEDMPEIKNWHYTPDFSEPTSPPPLAIGHPRAALFSDS